MGQNSKYKQQLMLVKILSNILDRQHNQNFNK